MIFPLKTMKTCWPTHNRQFFERTVLFIPFDLTIPVLETAATVFLRCQVSGWDWPDDWNKVLCPLARMILPLNSFLVRGKVLIGSTYGFRKLLPKLCFLALLFMLSSSALPGCLILHTLCLIHLSAWPPCHLRVALSVYPTYSCLLCFPSLCIYTGLWPSIGCITGRVFLPFYRHFTSM